jgi:predicted DNA-binding transcriptional regulator AlpA
MPPERVTTREQRGPLRTVATAGRPIALPDPILPGLPDRLWSHKETAAFLGIPEATLHQLNYKGTGPRSFKVGRHRRYDPRDLHEWLAERSSDYFG